MKSAGTDIANDIFTTLKAEILDLTVAPGQPVLEMAVCERFGASRTPVRTAFQRLSDAGLLEIVPYQGACATLLDMDQIRQMIYMRCAVETAVLTDFVALADPFAMEDVRHSLRRQEILLQQPSFTPSDFYAADGEFHKIWFDATHNEHLWTMIQKAEVNYTRFRMLDIVQTHMFVAILQEHAELVGMLEQGDIQQIKHWMTSHLNGGIRRLGEKLSKEYAPYFQTQKGSGHEAV